MAKISRMYYVLQAIGDVFLGYAVEQVVQVVQVKSCFFISFDDYLIL
jgi:hypothetical protein